MTRNVILAGSAGVVSALFWLTLGSTMPGALILVQLPLFAIGLAIGSITSFIACGTAFFFVLAMTALVNSGLFALIAIVPVLMLLYLGLQSRQGPDQSVEWYPIGFLMAWLSALALAYLLAVGLYFSSAEGGLEGVSAAVLTNLQNLIMARFPEVNIDDTVVQMTRILPGAALGSWQMTVVVSGILAQGVVSRFGRNIRRFTPFSDFTLPQWIGYVLVACLIASFATGQIGYLGRNGAILVAIPFFFLGLSVIHAVSRGWRGREFGLPLLYLFMMFLGWPALIVAGLGFVEQWFGLRRRFAARSTGQEDE
jgi:hypothetical protein